MPPWYLDRTIGVQEFKNDASLSNREIETISAWVDAGAPRGNPADLPAPREFDDSNRWTLPGGEPDLVVYAPEHTVQGQFARGMVGSVRWGSADGGSLGPGL